jgi:Flp pilus assembly protein TadD
MAHAGRGLGLIVVVAVAAGACASADHTLASRFVRQGTPSVDIGGPKQSSMRPNDRAALLRRARLEYVPPPAAASLESSNPDLKEALAGLLTTATSEKYLEVADAYRRQGIFDRAHDYLTRSLAVNGPDVEVYDALARLWRDWGQPGEGLAHAHRAVYLAPRSPIVHNTLGTVLYRMGLMTDARASFSRAFELDPTAWYALGNLCHLDMKAGNTRAAIAECHKAAAIRKAAHVQD